MNIEDKIIIRSDFTENPGARYKSDGLFSGEEFLEKLLEDKFIKAKKNNYTLLIDLDGVWGYPSSFVSGSFGKLSLKYGSDTVLNFIEFKSDDSQIRKEKIISEIKNPRKS